MRWLALSFLAACASRGTELSADVRAERLATIRDVGAQLGLYNGALLGGIAISETNLAHCQAESPSSCPGPASPSCDGGPIIAGAADGPCAAMQGGLGMFQFDAGTYAQTVAAYGPDILTVEGSSAQAASFVIGKVEQDVPGATDWLAATAWLNQVPLVAGDPAMEQWAHVMACRYNGCCTASAVCTARANGYRDNAIELAADMPDEFWATAKRCAALPADGVIDQRSDCYLAAGEPRFWRHEATGYGGNLEWTMTTAGAAKASFGQWLIRTGRPGRYRVEIYLDGGTFGQSRQAAYVIAHAGEHDTVIVDQHAGESGFHPLGDYTFAGDATESVLLADNTGEAPVKLLFDAVRVTPVTPFVEPSGSHKVGVATGRARQGAALGAGALLLALVMLLVWRRQTARR